MWEGIICKATEQQRDFKNESSENVGESRLLDHQGHWWVELMSFSLHSEKATQKKGLSSSSSSSLIRYKPQQSGL